MRTFYIFKINNDYYKLTKNMPYNLYKALLNIKLGTKENITYLKNEYNSLVDKYNKIRDNSLCKNDQTVLIRTNCRYQIR